MALPNAFGVNGPYGQQDPNQLNTNVDLTKGIKLPQGMTPLKLSPTGTLGTPTPDTSGLFTGPGAPKEATPTFSQTLTNRAASTPGILTPPKTGTTAAAGGGTGITGAGTTGGASPADSHQAMIDTVQQQIGLLQSSLKKAQDAKKAAGYADTQEAQYDAQGRIIPANQITGTPGGSTNIGSVTAPTPTYNTANPPTVAGTSSQLANILNNPSPQVLSAQKAIVDLKNEYAQKGVNIQQTAGFLTQAGGEQGLLNQQYLTALDAAQNNLNAALTSQAQGIGALESAQGAVAPQQVSPTNVPFNPATGTYGTPAGQAYGPGGLNAVYSMLGAAQGAQTAAATGGAIQSQQQTQVAQYTSALQQGKNLQSQLTDLIKTFNLNPSDINAVNAGIQKIASNISDPRYQTLQNYINDIANTYAQILTPTGGSQTDTTRGIAASMLSQTASGTSLQAVMQSLDNAAQAKIAGIPTQTNQNYGTTTTGANPWH